MAVTATIYAHVDFGVQEHQRKKQGENFRGCTRSVRYCLRTIPGYGNMNGVTTPGLPIGDFVLCPVWNWRNAELGQESVAQERNSHFAFTGWKMTFVTKVPVKANHAERFDAFDG